MTKILICDVNVRKKGHYIGYDQYLLDNIRMIQQQYPEVRFLFNREAVDLLHFTDATRGMTSFLSVPEENSFKNRLANFRAVVKVARRSGIDHLILMDLDQYQLCVFLTPLPCKLSGILFRPHHRIFPPNKKLSTRILSQCKRLKKKISEKMLLANRGIHNIFILNDRKGAAQLNRLHGAAHFKYLPDPVFDYGGRNPHADGDGLSGAGRTRYLVFGALSERKNIANIIRSYGLAELSFPSELLLVGTADKGYLESLQTLAAGFPAIEGRHKSVTIKAGFVSNEEMDHYFSNADVCLLIYKDFFGSSGLLGRAALHRRKVIGANVGLIAELVHTYRIGLTCDPGDTADIASALRTIGELDVPPAFFDKLYQDHSPEYFLYSLIEPIIHEGTDAA